MAQKRKEFRAMNRIRKRCAELDLLLNTDGRGEDDDKMGAKRAKGTAAIAKECEASADGLGLAPTTSSSSVSVIARSTATVKIGDDADDDIADVIEKARKLSKELHQLPTTSSTATVKIGDDGDADVIEKARKLSKELRQQRPKSGGVKFESKLQLHKLNGKTLGEREMAAFLHRHMLGSLNTPNRAGANWLRFEGGRKPLQIVLIRVECADPKMLHTNENAKFIDEYFGLKWLRLHQSVRDRQKFWRAISTTTHSLRELLIRKIKDSGDPLLSMRVSERKAQLLMSLADMTLARYPFPTSAFDENTHSSDPKIRASRPNYRRVNERSPIFVIDCEMCLTTAQRLELTRISMVNEAGETLLDELVKPHNKIIDYITSKSGITEHLLRNVHTRLKDVQKRVCALLTDDAILCGHSLENDLLALQLSHPFCIDTSIVFNFSGRLNVRSGLKALADIFLNEQIQTSSRGHCSLQDALATLKLLKLKLEKGLMFGNVALGWNFTEWAAANGMTRAGTRLNKKGKANENEDDTGAETEKDSSLFDMTIVEQTAETPEDEHRQAEAVTAAAAERGEEVKASREKKEEEGKECSTGNGENKAEKECAKKKETEEKKEWLNAESKEKKVMGEKESEHLEGGGETVLRGQKAAAECPQKQKKTKSIKEASESERFDFSEAVRIDNAMQQTSSLSDCFRQIHGVGKNGSKKMLVAGRQMDEFFKKNESCVLMDLRSGRPGQLSANCANMAAGLMEYDIVLVDLHCPEDMTKHELDVAFRHVVDGMCHNSYCLLLMRVHQRPKKDASDSIEPNPSMNMCAQTDRKA
uniref:Exonuclease domain-containing protein n=1 Tax=Globodera rostochiensis TaxID=31243 RepID=A0A914H1K2_GLORO